MDLKYATEKNALKSISLLTYFLWVPENAQWLKVTRERKSA
jgi:hypothetical protein